MRIERQQEGIRNTKVVDWGEQEKYTVELHLIRKPGDGLVRSARRLLGDTHVCTYHEEGISFTRAKQVAGGVVEHYQNTLEGSGVEFEVRVLPTNFALLLQG